MESMMTVSRRSECFDTLVDALLHARDLNLAYQLGLKTGTDSALVTVIDRVLDRITHREPLEAESA
jgi:hypothetical protein